MTSRFVWQPGDVEWGPAQKYSDDEPRDDHGRWSSEGGESSGDIRDLSGLKPYTGRGSQSHGTRGYSANLQTAWRAHQVMAAIGIKDYHLLGGPSVFWRDEGGIHRYRLKDLEEHAARHTTKAATPVTADSGGEPRDHAVDRIVGRVRQSLVRLAEAAAPAQKYSDDQPRDDHGRWTSDGAVAFDDAKTAEGWSKDHYKPWFDAIFGESGYMGGPANSTASNELSAIDHYGTFQYQIINGVMRGSVPAAMHFNPRLGIADQPVTPEQVARARTDAANLSMAIERTPPLDQPVTVWRSFEDSGLKVGDSFTDKGFVSTSLVPDRATPGVGAVKNQTLAEITLPAGTHACPIPDVSFGTELVLQAGTTFRVDAAQPGSVTLSIAKPGDLVLTDNVGKGAKTDGRSDPNRYLWRPGDVIIRSSRRGQ